MTEEMKTENKLQCMYSPQTATPYKIPTGNGHSPSATSIRLIQYYHPEVALQL